MTFVAGQDRRVEIRSSKIHLMNNVLMVCLEIKFGSLANAAVANENDLNLQKYMEIAKIVAR